MWSEKQRWRVVEHLAKVEARLAVQSDIVFSNGIERLAQAEREEYERSSKLIVHAESKVRKQLGEVMSKNKRIQRESAMRRLQREQDILDRQKRAREREIQAELEAERGEKLRSFLDMQRHFDETVMDTQASLVERARRTSLHTLREQFIDRWSRREQVESSTEYEKRVLREKLQLNSDLIHRFLEMAPVEFTKPFKRAMQLQEDAVQAKFNEQAAERLVKIQAEAAEMQKKAMDEDRRSKIAMYKRHGGQLEALALESNEQKLRVEAAELVSLSAHSLQTSVISATFFASVSVLPSFSA